jgi:hypothetical protein
MEFFLIWIFSMIIGCMIGAAKDRVGSGFVWSFLFGPLGVLVVLCLPNLKKQKEEADRKQQLALQLQLQQAQLQKLDQIHRSVPPPPGYEPKLRIASNGQDLGEMPVATVKLMLKSGKLNPQDYYFDTDSNDWMQLDCCPALV